MAIMLVLGAAALLVGAITALVVGLGVWLARTLERATPRRR
jgi:hypothetical protein